jgi:hypothetical protein
MKSAIASEHIVPSRLVWWSGTGWSDRQSSAKVFTTELEIESTLARMSRDGVQVMRIDFSR